MLGVVACAWRVKSGAGSQKSNQIIYDYQIYLIFKHDECLNYSL